MQAESAADGGEEDNEPARSSIESCEETSEQSVPLGNDSDDEEEGLLSSAVHDEITWQKCEDELTSRCRALGHELPPHLQSRRARWLSLAGICAAVCLAAGPVITWPTLEPVLIEMGKQSDPHRRRLP